jgi:hypothetical protein
MSSSAERLSALSELARLTGADEPLLSELRSAWNEPARYVDEHSDRLSDRGILQPFLGLPFIALVDGLQQRKLCRELDWREDPETMVEAVRELLAQRGVSGWQAPELDDGEELPQLMGVVDASLAPLGLSLCALDIQSDCYPIVLVPAAEVQAAQTLADTAGVGKLLRFGP